MEETVRSSLKSSHISMYFSAARSSGKLHAVTSSTLEITSVRMELLIPYSAERPWPPSLTCDQYSFGIVVMANSFGREFGEFSYESPCSWGWALARPPTGWTVTRMLSRGWDLALAKEHMHAFKA